MSALLPDREEEPLPPGYQAWSPTMGRGAKAVAMVILAVMLLGLGVMVWTVLG